jgi:hypothetical protein
MGRIILVLVLLIAGFAIVYAPAGLLRHVLPQDSSAVLTGHSGTLWNGNANLLVDGQGAGQLAWELAPVTILRGALGYHLQLTGPQQALAAELALRPGGLEVTVNGAVDAAWFDRWIARYDIRLGGKFAFESVRIETAYGPGNDENSTEPAPGSADGRLTWTGGPVHYQLSGRQYDGLLPPLEARFGKGLSAVVYPSTGEPTLLLRAELLANGFMRIGMTRLLTRLLNNPWPGGDADHEVVLEVEEQVL